MKFEVRVRVTEKEEGDSESYYYSKIAFEGDPQVDLQTGVGEQQDGRASDRREDDLLSRGNLQPRSMCSAFAVWVHVRVNGRPKWVTPCSSLSNAECSVVRSR